MALVNSDLHEVVLFVGVVDPIDEALDSLVLTVSYVFVSLDVFFELDDDIYAHARPVE